MLCCKRIVLYLIYQHDLITCVNMLLQDKALNLTHTARRRCPVRVEDVLGEIKDHSSQWTNYCQQARSRVNDARLQKDSPRAPAALLMLFSQCQVSGRTSPLVETVHLISQREREKKRPTVCHTSPAFTYAYHYCCGCLDTRRQLNPLCLSAKATPTAYKPGSQNEPENWKSKGLQCQRICFYRTLNMQYTDIHLYFRFNYSILL